MIKAIRLFLGLIYLILSCTIGIIYCLFRPFYGGNTLFLGRILSFGMLPIMGIKIHVEGRENFEKIQGPAIILSNHQDNMDLFLVGAFVSKKTVSIGKKIIKYFPFIGQIYWLSGNILIDRKRKKKALGAMNQAGEQMIKKGIKVWIMPEGTRSRGRGLLPFKKGAFHLAHQTKRPIINVSFSSYAKHWDISKAQAHHVYVKIDEPMVFKPEEYPEPNELKEICEAKIKENIALVDKKAGYTQ